MPKERRLAHADCASGLHTYQEMREQAPALQKNPGPQRVPNCHAPPRLLSSAPRRFACLAARAGRRWFEFSRAIGPRDRLSADPREKTVNQTVRVEIYDQAYHLRGEMQESYARELAQYVDEKMRAVAAETRTVDSLRVAVLTAIHLADEVFIWRARQKELEGEIR
jgi:cell division protein ZapA